MAGRREGAVSVIGAFVLPALLVTMGLAVEYGNGMLHKLQNQRIADAAAFAAATVYSQNSSASLTSVVDAIGSLDGISTSNITASLVSSPSGNGSQAVLVTVTTSVPLFLSQALGNTTSVLTATASSYAELTNSDDCVLSLDPASSGNKPAQMTGGIVTLGCSMQVNSTSSSSFDMTGGTFTANNLNVGGQISKSGGTLTATQTLNAHSVSDPFAGLYSANSVSSVTNQSCPVANNNVHFNSTTTVTPPSTGQVYCGGLTVSGGTVTFQPGVYIIQGGNFNVSGGSLQGTGVTIILTCGSPPCTSASNNWAQMNLTGGTTTLAAPTTGAWAGILAYQDPTNSTDAGHDTNSITGGGNSLKGTLYFPNETTDFTGGATAATCTQIVTYDITFTGGGTINHNCVGTGVAGIGYAGVRLVQ